VRLHLVRLQRVREALRVDANGEGADARDSAIVLHALRGALALVEFGKSVYVRVSVRVCVCVCGACVCVIECVCACVRVWVIVY